MQKLTGLTQSYVSGAALTKHNLFIQGKDTIKSTIG